MARILVTGADGFVGRQLVRDLSRRGHGGRLLYRTAPRAPSDQNWEQVVVDLCSKDDFTQHCAQIDVVIHAAARVHTMVGSSPEMEMAYLQSNYLATSRLFDAAVCAGVGKFIFLSTIKVLGESTQDVPFNEGSRPNPRDAYARSKWVSEILLTGQARQSAMPVTIIRLPMVYGPGARGSVLRLAKPILRGVALPLAAIENRRSMVGLGNACDMIVHVVERPEVHNKVLLVSDPTDLSTPEFARLLGQALGRPARLFRFPPSLLLAASLAVGQGPTVQRLCESLQVDSGDSRRVLGWMPPFSVEDEFERMGEWFRSGSATEWA